MVSYTDLAGLMTAYGDVGLTVLAFPCNDFGAQEPGTAQQVREVVRAYSPLITVMGKVHVNDSQAEAGPAAHPVYQFLKGHGADIRWNFGSSFVVPAGAHVAERYDSADFKHLENEIRTHLGASGA